MSSCTDMDSSLETLWNSAQFLDSQSEYPIDLLFLRSPSPSPSPCSKLDRKPDSPCDQTNFMFSEFTSAMPMPTMQRIDEEASDPSSPSSSLHNNIGFSANPAETPIVEEHWNILDQSFSLWDTIQEGNDDQQAAGKQPQERQQINFDSEEVESMVAQQKDGSGNFQYHSMAGPLEMKQESAGWGMQREPIASQNSGEQSDIYELLNSLDPSRKQDSSFLQAMKRAILSSSDRQGPSMQEDLNFDRLEGYSRLLNQSNASSSSTLENALMRMLNNPTSSSAERADALRQQEKAVERQLALLLSRNTPIHQQQPLLEPHSSHSISQSKPWGIQSHGIHQQQQQQSFRPKLEADTYESNLRSPSTSNLVNSFKRRSLSDGGGGSSPSTHSRFAGQKPSGHFRSHSSPLNNLGVEDETLLAILRLLQQQSSEMNPQNLVIQQQQIECLKKALLDSPPENVEPPPAQKLSKGVNLSLADVLRVPEGKKRKAEEPFVSSSAKLARSDVPVEGILAVKSAPSPVKVRKESTGDRIAILRQMVAPQLQRGDTATVLGAVVDYLRSSYGSFQERFSVNHLSSTNSATAQELSSPGDQSISISNQCSPKALDLRSQGYCLVPISSAERVSELLRQ